MAIRAKRGRVRKGKAKEWQLAQMLLADRDSFGPVVLVESTSQKLKARAVRRLTTLPPLLIQRGRGLRRQSPQIDLILIPTGLATKLVATYDTQGWHLEKVEA